MGRAIEDARDRFPYGRGVGEEARGVVDFVHHGDCLGVAGEVLEEEHERYWEEVVPVIVLEHDVDGRLEEREAAEGRVHVREEVDPCGTERGCE